MNLVGAHPHLAAQWHPELNGEKTPHNTTSGSSYKAWWLCAKDHVWQAPVSRRASRNSGCPYCSGRYAIVGENDLATMRPDIAKLWDYKHNAKGPENYLPKSHTKVWWVCDNCAYNWEAPINNRSTGRGCPACSQHPKALFKGYNDLATRYPELLSSWDQQQNKKDPSDVMPGSHEKIWWLCAKGHSWKAAVYSVVSGGGCPYCSGHSVAQGENDLATKFPLLSSQWHPTKNKTLAPYQVTSQSGKKVWWLCANGHEWVARIGSRAYGDNGCPYCSGFFAIEGETDLATLRPEIAVQLSTNETRQPSTLTVRSSYKALWVCNKGHEWRATVGDRTRLDGRHTDCPRCSMNGTSRAEQELYEYVKSICPDAVFHDSSLAQGFEYDISVPSKRIAMEYNGVYWHSEKFKGKNYHRDKSLATDYQVIHVWEDDDPAVVRKMLAHKLGVSAQTKYNARSLTIKNVESQASKAFLNENHVQGAVGGSVRLGLYTKDGDELVALMVFKIRNKATGVWELVRFATNGIVRGGFSKLFKNFTRNYHPEQVVSFSDIGVSDGGIYTNNCFVQDGEVKPDYKYAVGTTREHKFNYRLKRFKNDPELQYREGLTESQLAELNGLERVYDCGKIRWVWSA